MNELDSKALRKLIADAMAKQQQPQGMGFDQRLFDKSMSDPRALEAGADMAGLMNDNTALGLMSDVDNFNVPNGGEMGWTQAMSKGIDKGLGTYNLLHAQKVKADALRAMAPNAMPPVQGALQGQTQGATGPVATAYPVNMN
jgi:hypothetical protein